MKDIIKIFYDTKTTGFNPRKNSIHQIAGIVEINDEVIEEFNIFTKPHPKAIIEDAALAINKKTRADLEAYQDMSKAHQQLTNLFGKYLDKYNPKSKAWLVGYNNRAFDDVFLDAWFTQNGDTFLRSWVYPDSLDVMVLASQYLIKKRSEMSSFKLHRVAKTLSLNVNDDCLHDALYDARLTRQIYRIVTDMDFDITSLY